MVKKVKHRLTREEFAAKFIRKKRAKASRRGVTLDVIKREVDILLDIDHENIVKLYDVFEDDQDVILIMELYESSHWYFLNLSNKRYHNEPII